MILNAYSVLAAFAAGLRVVVGVLILFFGLRRRREGARFHLLLVLSLTLLGLAVVSWPLLYLVLQSYVPEWPRVMCIQGVTRIGAGSIGASSHLPGLLDMLEVTRPLLLFLAGSWFVLHLAHRRQRDDRLQGRVVLALLLGAGVAAADGMAEIAYHVIPKTERFLSAGCCTYSSVTGMAGSESLYTLPIGAAAAPPGWLTPAFFGLGALLLIVLTRGRRGRRRRRRRSMLRIALPLAAISLPIGALFLDQIASPAFLHLPFHRCAYCLLSSAPESLVAIGLYVGGAFATGWAALAGTEHADPLLRFARFGYLAAIAMTAIRLLVP